MCVCMYVCTCVCMWAGLCVLTHFLSHYYNTFNETTELVGDKIKLHKNITDNTLGPNDVLFTFVRLSIQTPTGK